MKDNWCEKALDLTNRNLIVTNNWPMGIFCQWSISAENGDDYVTLEFQKLDVKIPKGFVL